MRGTAGDDGVGERAAGALPLVVHAARRAPVPEVAGAEWQRYGALLVPGTTAPGDLPAALAAMAGGGAPVRVQVERPSRGARAGGAAPHAVLLSRIATDRTRVRSFPLDADARPLATLTVHSRRPLSRGRLRAAARTQQEVGRDGSLRVPAVLGAGRSPGGEWLAEEHVEGRHLRPDEISPAAGEVAAGLARHWGAAAVGTRTLRAPAAGVAEVEALLGTRAAEDVGAAGLGGPLRALAARDVAMAVGPCHGDPVVGNVLRTGTGDLVLLDWEHAGPGVLARDLVKVVLGVPAAEEGHALLAEVAPAALAGRAGAAGWRDQVGLTLLEWLAGWRQEELVQGRSGRAAPFQRRLRRRLSLLQLALEG